MQEPNIRKLRNSDNAQNICLLSFGVQYTEDKKKF